MTVGNSLLIVQDSRLLQAIPYRLKFRRARDSGKPKFRMQTRSNRPNRPDIMSQNIDAFTGPQSITRPKETLHQEVSTSDLDQCLPHRAQMFDSAGTTVSHESPCDGEEYGRNPEPSHGLQARQPGFMFHSAASMRISATLRALAPHRSMLLGASFLLHGSARSEGFCRRCPPARRVPYPALPYEPIRTGRSCHY